MPSGRLRDLLVPAHRASAHARVCDHPGPSGHSRCRAHPFCLPSAERRRHPGRGYFRGSMAGLCAPLSTLRRGPHRPLRMTRGRCGSLLLHRDGLAPSTPCRSPGALRFTLDSDRLADVFEWELCANKGLMHRGMKCSRVRIRPANNASIEVIPSDSRDNPAQQDHGNREGNYLPCGRISCAGQCADGYARKHMSRRPDHR